MLPKGFGFLLDDRNVSWFFVARECWSPFDSMHPGDKVAFDKGVGNEKGPRAIRVGKVSDLEESA
jgi:cold shock CspA family protein